MRKECLLRGSVRQYAPCPSTRVPIIGDPVGEVVLRSISWFRVRIRSPNIFLPRSAQPFLVMTDGAFVALVFVLSNLVDWLVSLISPLAYLPVLATSDIRSKKCVADGVNRILYCSIFPLGRWR